MSLGPECAHTESLEKVSKPPLECLSQEVVSFLLPRWWLVWDITCPDTLASSYSSLATRMAGAVAEEAERRKRGKDSHLETSHHFTPVAVESLGHLCQMHSPSSRTWVASEGGNI